MIVTARITGVEETRARLAKLRAVAQEQVMRYTLLAGAERMAEEARLQAPRDSGDLQDSIMVGTDAVDGAPDALAFMGPERRRGFYGHMVEFGTVDTTPNAFMRRAFIIAYAACLDAIANALAREVDQAARS